ncbi:MAG: Spy/CpxP family protein refolding chaperone [Verrucomicrobiales bacterium]
MVILLAALAAGLVAFGVMRWHKAAGHSHGHGVALHAMPELSWLRDELNLSEEQFIKVRDLHAAYRPKCVELCRRISEAHKKIESFASSHRVITPDYKAALDEHATIHVECQEAMLNHLYETAGMLTPEQSKRYLETMLPFALDFTPSELGTLDVR